MHQAEKTRAAFLPFAPSRLLAAWFLRCTNAASKHNVMEDPLVRPEVRCESHCTYSCTS